VALKRWSLTSNVTPTPTSDSDSTPRLTYPTIFSRLSTSILTFLQAVEPNLQRHPYTNIGFRFPSSPYLPYDFFPPLYLHFNFFEAVEPYLQRHPYANIKFGFASSRYPPCDFFPPLYTHFRPSRSGGALPPTSHRRHLEVQERVMPGWTMAVPILQYRV